MELRWIFLPAVIALAGLHYMLTAVALRAVVGQRLPLWETVLTQFAAAAANRVTPGGLGGSLVNVRFLTGRGLPLCTAITAVAAMHVLGGLANVSIIVALSPWVGGEVLSRLFGALNHPVILVVAGLGGCAALVWMWRRPRGDRWATACTGISDLLRRPRDLLVLLSALVATTITMGVAFALSAFTISGASSPHQTGTIISAYLIGAPLSAVVPIPGGVGSTEAVLIAALGAADVATGHAIQSVLLFRGITHWAPVPIGVLSARWALRKTTTHKHDESKCDSQPSP